MTTQPKTNPADTATTAPPLDWQTVLRNLHLGWPEAVIAEAVALRDAALRRVPGR